MKNRIFWVGLSILLLAVVAMWVLFPIGTHTPQEVSAGSNDIDAIIALYPLEAQDEIRADYEAKMQRAKAVGIEGFAARFQEVLHEILREDVDDPIPNDYREAAQYYEAEIQKEKAAGASENDIAVLKFLRDQSINLARSMEEIERETREAIARIDALHTPEEKLAYYEEELVSSEEELLKDEEFLRRAIAKGDASEIRTAQMFLRGTQQDIESYKRRIAWLAKKPELDALLERAAASRSQMIDQYRHLLHTEVVDGVEHVVGVRTPDEIASSASEKSEGSSFPEEAPSLVPAVSEDVSSSPLVVENTPIPSFEGMPPQPFVKAET